jgi:nucleotide-binding universal stress UspA family protein
MLTIRSILAPTDFSEHAHTSLRYAVGLAEKFGATLHLVHILPDIVPVGPDAMLAPAMPPEYYTDSENQSKELLSKALDPAWGTPLALVTSARWGEAVEGVVTYAREQNIDLIVVATHGRQGLSHALLGSAAERILREAPCPVLTLKDSHP